MQIAVLSSFILAYCLFMLLFSKRARQADHLAGRINTVANMGATGAVDASELSKPFSERFLKPALKGCMKWLEGLMPQTENPRLATSLKQAGSAMKTGEYNAARLMAVFGTGFFGIIIGILLSHTLFSVVFSLPIGAAVALILMRFGLKSMIKKRKLAIQRQLPEVLDLLSVSVEAGLGFDAALQRIAERASGPLINELSATYREITLGRPRSEALRNFEQRCGLEEIKSFVGAVIQAEQLGISLKNVLKSQAAQMRLVKRQKVEERAMKAPVKIIFPLVLFVFPVLFIILLGPAVISIVGMQGVFG